MYKDLQKSQEKYLKEFKEVCKTNPELAKKKATEDLQRSGILDKDGNLAPPYNGQKVNPDDFTRGPKESSKC